MYQTEISFLNCEGCSVVFLVSCSVMNGYASACYLGLSYNTFVLFFFSFVFLSLVLSKGNCTATKITTSLEHSNSLVTFYRDLSIFLPCFAFMGEFTSQLRNPFLIVSFRNTTLRQFFPMCQ